MGIPRSPRTTHSVVGALALVVGLVGGVLTARQQVSPAPAPLVGLFQPTNTAFPTYAGVDWPSFENSFLNCASFWTWLQASCYNVKSSGAGLTSGLAVKDLIPLDIAYVTAQHLGLFHRVFVSLDQLMTGFDATTGYVTGLGAPNYGFDGTALADFDDAMAAFDAAGMSLDIVLYTNTQSVNGFHKEALDGNHQTMRAGYIQALTDFLTHLKNNAADARVVKVADLMNEGYYQLEQYYLTPANEGAWNNTETGGNACDSIAANPCTYGSSGFPGPLHGCGTSSVDTTCIDTNIMYPFFLDEYNAAHAADPAILYTVSAAAGSATPLATSASAFVNQAWYMAEYPVDIYDLHQYQGTSGAGYADGPWSAAQDGKFRKAATLNHPWFVGEAGCGGGNTACTYGGSANQGVDQYWLSNLGAYGAQAVLVEQGAGTVWIDSAPGGGVLTHTLTPLGQQVAVANGSGGHTRGRVRPRGR